MNLQKIVLSGALFASFAVFAQVEILPPYGLFDSAGGSGGGGGGSGTVSAGTPPEAAYYTGATTVSSTPQLQFPGTEVVVNEAGSPAVDFRVEGDTDQSLICSDSATDRVGFGTCSPTARIHSIGSIFSQNNVDSPAFIAVDNDNLGANALTLVGVGTPEGVNLALWPAAANFGGLGLSLASDIFSTSAIPNHWFRMDSQVGVFRFTISNSAGAPSNSLAAEKFRVAPLEVVVNEPGSATVDFRVEGDTDSSLIFADASADRVGIRDPTPEATLDVIGVAGTPIAQFNDNLADSDFVVKSTNESGMIYVDASVDSVGIGTGVPFSVLDVDGAWACAGRSANTSQTLNGEACAWNSDASGGNITLTLPSATSAERRWYYIIKTDATANTVTIDGNGTDTINGALTYVLSNQHDAVMIHSEGLGIWFAYGESSAISVQPGTAPNAAYYSATSTVDDTPDLQFPAAGPVVNEAGSATTDFRVEGDTETQLLFIDASEDDVIINGNNTTTMNFRVEGALLTSLFEVIAGSDDVVVNDSGGSTGTFRVEGDNDVNLIFTDGANDRVGIRQGTPTSGLHLGASFAAPIRTITTTDTAAATDYTILCDATGGAVTLSLPAASGVSGRIYNFKKIDATANACTIDPNGAETIDGAATLATTTQFTNTQFQSNGTAWFVL